jgi:hypothetical protein
VRAVIETNYLAADQMARRVAPLMVEQGWGRIVNSRLFGLTDICRASGPRPPRSGSR